jgi:hypothetical protein
MFRYKLRTLLIALAVVPPIIGAVAYGYLSTRQVAFTSSTWQAQPQERPRMIRDLLAQHLLDGKSQNEVLAILGAPDSTSDQRLIYWAGTDGVIDDMWLEVGFQNGNVVAVRYYPD